MQQKTRKRKFQSTKVHRLTVSQQRILILYYWNLVTTREESKAPIFTQYLKFIASIADTKMEYMQHSLSCTFIFRAKQNIPLLLTSSNVCDTQFLVLKLLPVLRTQEERKSYLTG